MIANDIKKEDNNITTIDDQFTIQISAPQLSFNGHISPVIAAEWLSNGNSIVSVSNDNSVVFWNSESGDIIHSVLHGR